MGVGKWHPMVVIFLVGIKLTKSLHCNLMTPYKAAAVVTMDVRLGKAERI